MCEAFLVERAFAYFNFGIPTVVEIKSTIKPFLGFIGGGDDVQFHNVYGYLFTEENRQILLSIVGFYFGSATARK